MSNDKIQYSTRTSTNWQTSPLLHFHILIPFRRKLRVFFGTLGLVFEKSFPVDNFLPLCVFVREIFCFINNFSLRFVDVTGNKTLKVCVRITQCIAVNSAMCVLFSICKDISLVFCSFFDLFQVTWTERALTMEVKSRI